MFNRSLISLIASQRPVIAGGGGGEVWVDRTSTTYFTSTSTSNSYSWETDKWTTPFNSTGLGQLLVLSDWTGGYFSDSFQPSKFRLTLNSGSDYSSTVLTGQQIEVQDSENDVVGSDSFDFTAYNQEITREIVLSYVSPSRFTYLNITTPSNNNGPHITKIEFLSSEIP